MNAVNWWKRIESWIFVCVKKNIEDGMGLSSGAKKAKVKEC